MYSKFFMRILDKSFKKYRPSIIFDIGANIGQSTIQYRSAYPNSYIYSFEPVQKAFSELRKSNAHDSSVFVHQLGFSSRRDTRFIAPTGTSPWNTIDRSEPEAPDSEQVSIERGDYFCKEHNLSKISFLKIDTEGHDMQVLIGFVGMLASNKVDFFQVEASMSPLNDRHIHFSVFESFANSLKYYLVHIEDMANDVYYTGLPYLRRANLIFSSSSVLERARANRK